VTVTQGIQSHNICQQVTKCSRIQKPESFYNPNTAGLYRVCFILTSGVQHAADLKYENGK